MHAAHARCGVVSVETLIDSSPVFRDMLLDHYRNWIRPHDDHVSVWPGTIDDAMEVDSATGSIHLTATFERHIQDCNNWKFHPDVLKLFPEAEHFGIGISAQEGTSGNGESSE